MNRARKSIESQYKANCTVYEYRTVENTDTHIKSKEEVIVFEDIKCKLSFESISTTSVNGIGAKAISTKLFCAPELNIKAGSKIVVTDQHGNATAYSNSGQPAIFTNHQEIMLELFERWA